MKFGVVVFPGSNCDEDCFYVLKDVLGVEVKYIWHREDSLGDVDCIVLPGGFSYGDYLRCGAVSRFSPVMKAVIDFASRGGLVIGICNGFQVLLESGLLPGAMLKNRDVHFICKYVYLKTQNNKTRFTHRLKENQVIHIPVAHNEGNYYIDDDGLKKLQDNDQIAFTYCNRDGSTDENSNPNGAVSDIAGIFNEHKNVLGMMPHPERSVEKGLASEDGLYIFNSILKEMM